ncbi:MLO-like protein 2 [Telopea speciosissima]|uniref:MLO-like protein 2 n=1 Tax=Telopea speciosissima TaxID=54955 RepID=UPI001CC54253|nr:MLO-like protein 2 [Telopea speciosissima]
MGTSMKPTIFNDNVATALKQWHHTAKKQIKHGKGSVTGTATPVSSRPSTPSRSASPIHLLRNYRGELSDDLPTSPILYNVEASPDHWELKDSPPTDNQLSDGSSTSHHQQQHLQKLVHRGSVIDVEEYERDDDESGEPQRLTRLPTPSRSTRTGQHEIDMGSVEFSFGKRPRT